MSTPSVSTVLSIPQTLFLYHVFETNVSNTANLTNFSAYRASSEAILLSQTPYAQAPRLIVSKHGQGKGEHSVGNDFEQTWSG
jgi:hypothetical protein